MKTIIFILITFIACSQNPTKPKIEVDLIGKWVNSTDTLSFCYDSIWKNCKLGGNYSIDKDTITFRWESILTNKMTISKTSKFLYEKDGYYLKMTNIRGTCFLKNLNFERF